MSAPGERWVSVGRVGRRHGLDGGFVVESASDDPGRFAVGARVYLDRDPALVVESKRAGGRLVIRLDRAAERGASIELPESELPPAGEGEFYAFQIEGLLVTDDLGHDVGRVVRLAPGVANDVLELDTGLALPFVEECVLEVDTGEGRIVVSRDFTVAE